MISQKNEMLGTIGLLLVILYCTALVSISFGQSSTKTEYNLTVSRVNPLRITVDAQLSTTGDTLYMSTNCPNYDYPEGWSSFIKNLSVQTQNGKAISYKYHTKSKWYLENKSSDKLKISYEIDLSFTKEKWDVGNEQAGYYDGDAVYLVTKALFIFGAEDVESIIRFDIPDEWNLSVPWKSTGNKMYIVSNREYLIENSLTYGKFYSAELNQGGFDFRIALLGEAKEAGEMFSSGLKKVANAYLRIFKKTPPTIYLITIFYADLDDGESFYNSNTFTLKEKMDMDNKIIWANQMAHELFHYWNSDLMQADSYADRQWFSEGTAEYYANLTLVRNGIISEDLFKSKMEKVLALYQNYRGWREKSTSLLKAGESKGKDRVLVYNGGWAVALALDVTIMEATNGKKTLDDFMEEMFNKYSETTYSYKDLIQTVNEVAGINMDDFFAKYVEGTQLLPLDKYLDKLGYRMLDVIYEAEIYLVPMLRKQSLRDLWLRTN